MQSRVNALAVTALALGVALAVAAPAQSAEPEQIGGKNTCKITEQHVIPVTGHPGHVLIVRKGICKINATGPHRAKFANGQETIIETDDLVNGNGAVRGYWHDDYKGGSTWDGTYAGQVKTTMVGGKPHTSAYGTWESTNGTDSFAGTHAVGALSGGPGSANELVITWDGTMTEARK